MTEKLRPFRPQIERRLSKLKEKKTAASQSEQQQLAVLSHMIETLLDEAEQAFQREDRQIWKVACGVGSSGKETEALRIFIPTQSATRHVSRCPALHLSA